MNNIDIIKILMADDDADDREFFREALADSGIANELTEVAGGRELLGLLSGGEAPIVPDVIFLDLHMPGLDGKFCLGEIRRQDQFSRVPVIILSPPPGRRTSKKHTWVAPVCISPKWHSTPIAWNGSGDCFLPATGKRPC